MAENGYFDASVEKPWFSKPILINNLTPVFLMLIVKNAYFYDLRQAVGAPLLKEGR